MLMPLADVRTGSLWFSLLPLMRWLRIAVSQVAWVPWRETSLVLSCWQTSSFF